MRSFLCACVVCIFSVEFVGSFALQALDLLLLIEEINRELEIEWDVEEILDRQIHTDPVTGPLRPLNIRPGGSKGHFLALEIRLLGRYECIRDLLHHDHSQALGEILDGSVEVE